MCSNFYYSPGATLNSHSTGIHMKLMTILMDMDTRKIKRKNRDMTTDTVMAMGMAMDTTTIKRTKICLPGKRKH